MYELETGLITTNYDAIFLFNKKLGWADPLKIKGQICHYKTHEFKVRKCTL